MNPRISNFYWLFVNFIYERISHEKMSNETKNFFSNLSYVGFGTFIAIIFSFSFNVLVGRLLGPAEYGDFGLVQSIAMVLYFPMLMGSDYSMVKYNSEKKEFKRQQEIISITFMMVFIQIFAAILLYLVFKQEILPVFSISSNLFDFSLIFAVLYVFYTLITETLKSLHEMKKYAILQPVFSIILLVSFLCLFHINLRSSRSAIFAMYITYGITSLIYLPFVWRYIKLNFNREWIARLAKYSGYATIGGLSFVLFTNIDNILLNKYIGVEHVGLYRAYKYSFTALALLVMSVFRTVFFPYASMCENKQLLLKIINKSVFYVIVIGLPIIIICGLVVFKIFGDEYAFDPKLALLSGFTGICLIIQALYIDLMNSVGIRGIKLVSFAAIIMALVNIGHPMI